MTDEEMVQARVRAVTELDQDFQGEEKALCTMVHDCTAMSRRYPQGHPLAVALEAACNKLVSTIAAYTPYLPPVYGFDFGVQEEEVTIYAAPS